MKRVLVAVLALALLSAATARADNLSGGLSGATTPSGSVGDLQTNADGASLGHITPGSGVAAALANTAGGSGGFALQSGLAAKMGTAGELSTSAAFAAIMSAASLTGNSKVLSSDGSGNLVFSTTLPSGLAATNMALTTPAIGVATGASADLTGFLRLESASAPAGVSGAVGIYSILGVGPSFVLGTGLEAQFDFHLIASSNKLFIFPNVSGTLVSTGDTGTVTNTMLASIGTSGATIPLNNTNNVHSGAETFGETHGTTYAPTLTSNNYNAATTDCGKILLFPTGTTPTLTLPNLNAACTINVIQNSATQFTPQAASGGTLSANVNSFTKSKAQGAFLTFTITVPSASAATWAWTGDGA